MEELNTTNNAGSVESAETEQRTYTQEEVDALLQKEGDRRVTAALKKQEIKNATAVREAQKVAAMSAEEKYRYDLEQREAQIIAKERELLMAENKNECSKILSDKGLSLDLVDFCVAETAEEMDANIKRLEKAFKASVKQEVEKRLASPIPKKSLGENEVINKDQFSKIKDINKLMEIKRNEPELWESLTKGLKG